MQIDFLIKARWVICIDTDKRVLENATLALNKGKVVAIHPENDVMPAYEASETMELNHHILLPGLINLHTHAAMTLMRGLADDLSLMDWLQKHIWVAEKQILSERFVRDGTLLACAEMLKSGTTCFNDMYFFPNASAETVLKAGMRANLGLVVMEFPTNYANDADDYLRKGFDVRDQWRNQDLLGFCLAPHAPYTVSNKSFEKVMTYAEQLHLNVHLHLHETQVEIEESEKEFGSRPLSRLKNIGVLGPNLVAAHGVHLLDGELDTLAEYGCHIAHCPSSNLKLASGVAPVKSMLNKQINVGLGTDGAASNNRLDMFTEMRLAALLAKGKSGDATTVSAQQALEMATINAAKALGLEDQIGSIAVGKHADLIAVSLEDVELQPCYDPVSHLVYVCGREHVSHVWVAGELRYNNKNYAGIEPQEIKEAIAYWQPKLTKFKA